MASGKRAGKSNGGRASWAVARRRRIRRKRAHARNLAEGQPQATRAAQLRMSARAMMRASLERLAWQREQKRQRRALLEWTARHQLG